MHKSKKWRKIYIKSTHSQFSTAFILSCRNLNKLRELIKWIHEKKNAITHFIVLQLFYVLIIIFEIYFLKSFQRDVLKRTNVIVIIFNEPHCQKLYNSKEHHYLYASIMTVIRVLYADKVSSFQYFYFIAKPFINAAI